MHKRIIIFIVIGLLAPSLFAQAKKATAKEAPRAKEPVKEIPAKETGPTEPTKTIAPAETKESKSNASDAKKSSAKSAPKEEEDPEELLKKYAGDSGSGSGIGNAVSAAIGEPVKPKFELGGFMDVQAVKATPIKGSNNKLYRETSDSSFLNEGLFYPLLPNNTSFRLANINLYTTFNVTDSWKAFAELRFLTALDGNRRRELGYTTAQNSGSMYVQSGYNGSGNAYDGNGVFVGSGGGVLIERAYIEWSKYEWLGFRAGKFFTPLGLWNQDHGAPILTSIRLPLTVTNPLTFAAAPPLWNTGGQVFGKFFIGDDASFNYIAFVGNGQCNDCDRVDEDRNKAFGGFGNFTFFNLIPKSDLDIGGSGYNGDRTVVDYYYYRQARVPYTYQTVAITLEQNIASAMQNSVPQSVPYSTASTYDPMFNSYTRKQNDVYGAGHIKLTTRDLPFDGTFVLQVEGWRQFTVQYPHTWDAGRTYASNIPNSANLKLIKPENYTVNTYYIQAEYRFYGKYTPYIRYDNLTNNMLTINSGREFVNETFGFNYKPHPQVVFKIETTLVKAASVTKVNTGERLYGVSLSIAF